MDIIPAIDIRGGKCVRLYQGDYERETVFSDSPLDVAARCAELGASRLHVVDLDGAKSGMPTNLDLVGSIASSVTASVQYGGGVRTLATANRAVALGVDRVIIGTAAAEGPSLVQEACSNLGTDAVVVSIDARDGYVGIEGWTRQTRIPAMDLLQTITQMGVRRFVYTDVARDGTLSEPNFSAIEELATASELAMIVAGGISSVDHLVTLSRLGIEGAIVGKAIHTGDVDLREAIETLSPR